MTDPVDDVSEDSTPLYFTEEDLEARLSSAVVRRLLDDNNDGETDFNPLQQVRKDASSKVSGACLVGVYTFPLTKPYPHEVVRIALDVAVAMLAERHPEVVKKDPEKLFKKAEDELEAIRTGKTRLDASLLPPKPTNQTTKAISMNPCEDAPKKFFVGGTSDF